ncbi:hypothetical protein SEVIR_7G171250v4 [Setaria viridis]
MIAPEPEVTTVDDGVDWHYGDSTLLYDPRFRFPLEELVALARAHARCPGLVHRELRRVMDADDVARVFGLEGAVGVGGSGGGSGSTAGFAKDGGTTDGDAGFDQEPGYVMVEEPAEELDYVLVGTADEVEREQRREADAEAGWKDRVRSIEELLEDAGVEEDAADEEEDELTARRKKLIPDIDRSLEEEAAVEPGWNIVARTIEQHFACVDNEAAIPE